jgi:hypothetical protein
MPAVAPMTGQSSTRHLSVICQISGFVADNRRNNRPINPSLPALRHHPSPERVEIDPAMPPSLRPIVNA